VKISDVYSSLVAVWTEWQKANFLINPRYIRRGNTVTWSEDTANIIDEAIYQSHIINMIDQGQYSFQINPDESILQLRYVYSQNDELLAANLAYYSLGEDSDVPVGWLRIDYDPSSYRGALHPKCHMHVSSFPNMRFAVDGVPSPKQFVDFVALNCYPEIYQSQHADQNGGFTDINRMRSINTPFLHLDDPDLYQYLTHIRVPVETPAPVQP
jgi:hypothetical protein